MAVKTSQVGTSSTSGETSKVGTEGETKSAPTPLEFVPDPPRKPVTKEMVRELEDAGLFETAKVAEKLAS